MRVMRGRRETEKQILHSADPADDFVFDGLQALRSG
jgi:hypothetical protein